MASYNVQDVICYLERVLSAQIRLLSLFENPIQDADAEISIRDKRHWIKNLPAQLRTKADWERAGSAFFQLMDGFDDFSKPFYDFLTAVQEHGAIPYADVKRCLEESNIELIREVGSCSRQELYEGVRDFIAAAEFLLEGYKAKAE